MSDAFDYDELVRIRDRAIMSTDSRLIALVLWRLVAWCLAAIVRLRYGRHAVVRCSYCYDSGRCSCGMCRHHISMTTESGPGHCCHCPAAVRAVEGITQ